MDRIDKASQLEEAHRKAAIEAVRYKVGNDDASQKECVICGAEIPLARRKAMKGCKTCIDCQKETEK